MRSKSRENSDGLDSETTKEDTSTSPQTSLTETVKEATVADRPRTRRFVKQQEALEKKNNVKNEENNEPRRSSRDYNVSIDATIAGHCQVQIAVGLTHPLLHFTTPCTTNSVSVSSEMPHSTEALKGFSSCPASRNL